MARTHRDTLNARRRERRRAWTYTPGPPAADDYFDYSDPLNRYPRLRGGNMVMAPRPSGIWSDERYQDAAARRVQRRTAKRRERQNWRKDALDNLPVA